jgi:hypothetical protein
MTSRNTKALEGHCTGHCTEKRGSCHVEQSHFMPTSDPRFAHGSLIRVVITSAHGSLVPMVRLSFALHALCPLAGMDKLLGPHWACPASSRLMNVTSCNVRCFLAKFSANIGALECHCSQKRSSRNKQAPWSSLGLFFFRPSTGKALVASVIRLNN